MAITLIPGYKTSDGTRFFSSEQAVAYERELDSVAWIAARIPDSKLKHGKYKQHDRQQLLQIKRDLWPLVLAKVNAAEHYPEWLKKHPDDVHPSSGVGRVLDDTGGPVARAWQKLARFNFELGREYDQPYYANNPEKAEEV